MSRRWQGDKERVSWGVVLNFVGIGHRVIGSDLMREGCGLASATCTGVKEWYGRPGWSTGGLGGRRLQPGREHGGEGGSMAYASDD